jgi:hypothetical protein
MKTPTLKNPLASRSDGKDHHKTLLRQVAGRWVPENPQEAQEFVEECMARAQSIASIFVQYCWGDRVSVEDLKFGLEVIDDLLILGYSMMSILCENNSSLSPDFRQSFLISGR